MKIAILSDIHGNDISLRAVLKEIDTMNIDEIWFLGDYVGYYYNVDTVFHMIRKYDKKMIKGNHELLLEQSLNNKEKSMQIYNKYGSGIEYAKKLLSNEQKQFLCCLPEKMNLKIDGLNILICHGSPNNVCEYIYPDTSEDVKKKHLIHNVDFVFIGHSHYSFVYKYKKKYLVNVGSVGQNRNVGGVANWCLFDTIEKTCIIKETHYDTKSLIEQVKRINPTHKYLVDVLNRKVKRK